MVFRDKWCPTKMNCRNTCSGSKPGGCIATWSLIYFQDYTSCLGELPKCAADVMISGRSRSLDSNHNEDGLAQLEGPSSKLWHWAEGWIHQERHLEMGTPGTPLLDGNLHHHPQTAFFHNGSLTLFNTCVPVLESHQENLWRGEGFHYRNIHRPNSDIMQKTLLAQASGFDFLASSSHELQS